MPFHKKIGWIRRLRGLVRRGDSASIAGHFAAVLEMAKRTVQPIDRTQLADGPFISFAAILRDTPEAHLQTLLGSFNDHAPGSAELLLCGGASKDARTSAWLTAQESVPGVRVIRDPEGHDAAAAINLAIKLARGTWIGFVDPNDAMTPYVVALLAQAAKEHSQCQFIYTDEVTTDEELHPVGYLLKPAYDEVLLSSGNYIGGLACYRRDRLLSLGGARAGFEGAEDYDLLLRYVAGLRPDEIKHLPFPGYRRRTPPSLSPTAKKRSAEAARRALAAYYCGAGAETPVEQATTGGWYRVRFDRIRTQWPHVSIIIPNRNSFPLIAHIIDDLMRRTEYPDFEIIVVDNGTTDPKVIDLYERSKQGPRPFRCLIKPGPFNFSRQVNDGIAAATGELILLFNNDIEVIEPDWLREMVSCFDYPDTGIVGARLLYPDRRIQHAGVIIGLRGFAAHWLVGRGAGDPGPMGRLHARQSFAAVTGACMLVSRPCLEAAGEFDEERFAVAYNDIDFCLRAVAKGFRIVWTPFATLIHHESVSRGRDNRNPAKLARLKRERNHLRRLHHTGDFEDRAYSPWYGRKGTEPVLLLPDHLPKAR